MNRAVALLLVLAFTLAGCISSDTSDVQPENPMPEAPALVPKTTTAHVNETTGPAPNPAYFVYADTSSAGIGCPGGGNYGYQDFDFPLSRQMTQVNLTLSWGDDPMGAPIVPDLDLVVLDSDGEAQADCEGATGSNPEEVSIGLTNQTGNWTIRIVNFAGSSQDYHLELEVTALVPADMNVTAPSETY